MPDGQVSCTANSSRIGEIAQNDPANCLYSANVQSFAESRGWYDPKSGAPFRFCDAYGAATPMLRRICETRVWSILRRVAPSKHLSPDFHRSKPGAQPYPLWLPPDAKLTVAGVFALMRDHYEGTEYDMTQGIDAGPFGLPSRWRPLQWKVDGADYVWERPISTQQTAFSFIAQSRSWMPDAVGGLYWYGVDDTFTSCFVPLYICIDALAQELRPRQQPQVHVRLGLVDVQPGDELRLFEVVDDGAGNQRPARRTWRRISWPCSRRWRRPPWNFTRPAPTWRPAISTDYSVMHAEQTVVRWRELAGHLIVKYNDGYVRDATGTYQEVGYPEAWLRRVIKEQPEKFKLPPEKAEKK